MDIQRAKELLAVLSDGVNPLTGELLPEDDSCNQVEIVRALNTVLRYLDNQPQKSAKPSPDNAGKPWTVEDEEALSRMFDQGCTKKRDLQLLQAFARSNCGETCEAGQDQRAGSIQKKLTPFATGCKKRIPSTQKDSIRIMTIQQEVGNIPEAAPNCVASGMLLCRMTS